MRRIKEVIIIRTVDSDGSTFRAIMDALRDKRVEIIELAASSHNVLAFGNIEIYPERRIVLKAGEKVRLNHGEFSMLLLLASTPGQVFSKEQLYDAAWNEEYRYPSYTNLPDQYLAEATASRGYLADKPTVSPREWAQTAAIGIALRNAGFGLQFSAAGDSFDSPAVDELGGIIWSGEDEPQAPPHEMSAATASATAPQAPAKPIDPLEKAMNTPCPISKYSGRTLGQVLREDPHAILWVANKFGGDPEISAAAKLICEQAMEQSA